MTTATHVSPAGPAIARLLHPLAPAWSNRNRVAPFSLSPLWRDWLTDEGSLTQRLSRLQPGTFNVQIVRQYHGRPTTVERRALRLYHQQAVWVREVILKLGDTPLVWARTAVPLSSLNGNSRLLRGLGNRSLGSWLFRQPSLQRTPLRVSHCSPNDLGLQWSRRSVFTLRGKPLLVTEAFSDRLPEFAGS